MVVIGPTAVGKTALGLILAKKFNGEILSADSRQVYKHLDIGTGKDTTHFQWGIDLVNPDEPFNVSQYVKYAQKVLADIWRRGKLPIIVGGTGLYIKELLAPSPTLHIKQNKILRAKLFHCSIAELQKRLQKVDRNKWDQMNNSDRNNPRRLTRAIEVAGAGYHGSETESMEMDKLIIGLTAPYEDLYQRIDKRVEERLAAGMDKERERLIKYKLPDTIGYRGETAQEWKFAEHNYARRQLTYFKAKFKNTQWFDITQKNYREKIVEAGQRWYSGGDG